MENFCVHDKYTGMWLMILRISCGQDIYPDSTLALAMSAFRMLHFFVYSFLYSMLVFENNRPLEMGHCADRWLGFTTSISFALNLVSPTAPKKATAPTKSALGASMSGHACSECQ